MFTFILQLDEHGGEVDITSLHHGGTKVHMGGGHFSVIRDPWRFHSAFAGLLQPHESIAHSVAGGGGAGFGGGGIQQFHQHFTYINNERNEKTKVQNLVHHQHEGEVGSEEHHFSEHHDDHHLHHEHEHVGHHDDMGGGERFVLFPFIMIRQIFAQVFSRVIVFFFTN